MTHETAAGETAGAWNGRHFEEFGRKVDGCLGGLGSRVEEDARRAIAYLNDRVVPEVRRESSEALRSAAGQLARMAELLERGTGPKKTPDTEPKPGTAAGPGA